MCGGCILHHDGNKVYYASERPKAAIVIINEKIEGLLVRKLPGKHHGRIKLILGDSEVYMVGPTSNIEMK